MAIVSMILYNLSKLFLFGMILLRNNDPGERPSSFIIVTTTTTTTTTTAFSLTTTLPRIVLHQRDYRRHQQVLTTAQQHDSNLPLLRQRYSPSIISSAMYASEVTDSISGDKASRNDNKEVKDGDVVDVIVIGAGVGGLSCAALLAKYGYQNTICFETHDRPGGVAHSFTRINPKASKSIPFTFDSGPSLVSGLSSKGTNPLRQVLDAIDVADTIQWKTYDGWVVHDYADSKSFKITTGNDTAWQNAIATKAGIASRDAFVQFRNQLMAPGALSEASAYIPPMALRGGISSLLSLRPYLWKLLTIGTKGTLLTGPFSKVMDMYNVQDKFVRQWFDYLSFALSGLDAAHTQAAAVAYMMIDLHKEGAVLDYPMGGMDSIVQALVTGLEKHGGTLQLNCRVERLLLEEHNGIAECHGVVLADGRTVRAKHGVVCNAPLWNMARILQDSIITEHSTMTAVQKSVNEIRQQADDMYMTGSFMHLHLGIPNDGLPNDLECHHSVLDFNKNITDEQNMVIISIPTIFDPSLAPEGYHVIHAYTAACDNFDEWEPFLNDGMEIGKVGASPYSATAAKYSRVDGYQKLKEEKAEVLWRAIECVIPDVRQRAQRNGSIIQIGTPLTHRRYNQRYRGTYGPSNSPNKDVWELNGATTKIKGLLACGDTTFPGIGLPGVAASGTIAANSLVPIQVQNDLIKALRQKGALQ